HPDLAPNIWVNQIEAAGTPGVDDDGNGYVDDLNGWNAFDGNNVVADAIGHGTRVAGVIGARGNNGIGVAGMAWNARIMPVRAFADDETSVSHIIAAIEYALEFPEVRVINASFVIDDF